MRIALLLACAAAAVTLSNCAGYRLGPVKPARFEAIESIAVPTFKNETLSLGPRFSSPTRRSRHSKTTAPTIAKAADADAVLRGVITKLERRQLRAARFNQLRTRELGLTLEIDYTFEDARTAEVLYTGTARGTTNVFLDPNFQLSERQAINEAAQRAAQQIVSRIAEGWASDALTDEDEEVFNQGDN
ncbi:MAG: LPS assembly lipoprotein LptE [Verrucomicrobiales bacterium]